MKNVILIALALMLTTGCVTSSPSSNDEAREGCHTPLGFIPEGQTANGYLRQRPIAGESCQQGTLSCEGGVWSGPYIYPSCIP